MMKKAWMIMVVLAVVGAFGLLQTGTGYSQTEGNNIEFQERFNTFLEETIDMRQDLAVKQAEVQKEMLSAEPDRNKVALLTEEIYQLRDSLQVKAREAGVDRGLSPGTGCGCSGGGGFKS